MLIILNLYLILIRNSKFLEYVYTSVTLKIHFLYLHFFILLLDKSKFYSGISRLETF